MRFGPCTQSLLTGGSQSRVERFADKVAKIGSLFDLMQNSGQLCQACYLTRPSCELSRLAFCHDMSHLRLQDEVARRVSQQLSPQP